MIFENAKTVGNYLILDGYSKNKTIKGAIKDLAKSLSKYDKEESNALISYIDDVIINLNNQDNPDYIVICEDVEQASRVVNDDTNEYKKANYYLCLRCVIA